jgi:CDP-diacylglycerol--serine O-phosphatidyltransferase
MRRIRTVAVLPTMFTLGNLVCGFFAIVVASRIEAPVEAEVPRAPEIQFRNSPVGIIKQLERDSDVHNAMLAGWLIFLAMVFDALDGHVARLARTSSDFGAQLDSLCDVVTFGVAPAILLVKICPTFTFLHPQAIWVIAASYTACAAMRLARFNVETGEDDDHLHFSGLPSPAAGSVIASYAILFYTLRKETAHGEFVAQVDHVLQVILPGLALLVALLMVSRIPYPHVVNQLFRGQRSFGHVVGLMFAVVALMLVRQFSVPTICTLFALGPPIKFGVDLLRERKAAREGIF